MVLQKLALVNFKNYAQAELVFSEGINCFTGNNGEGKTNLLDAIHYLSFCKSFFNPVDSQNITHEMPFFVIQGIYDNNGETEEIYCGQKRNAKKQFKRNKKEYERLADHIGLLPLVMISPADSALITEGSEIRRKFVDTVISQYDKTYLDRLIRYNHALSQRNALLKQFAGGKVLDAAAMEIWDYQLVELGNQLHASRNDFVSRFIPIFQRYYELISGGKENVKLIYSSHLNDGSFELLLQQSMGKDMNMEYTTVGIHKDDLELLIHEYPIKKFGSQGQQKSYLIALKLAQFEFIKTIKKTSPILLLDDIHDKLDSYRVQQLMQLVSGNGFKQVFVTDTHYERMAAIFRNTTVVQKHFKIQTGVISE